MKKVSLLTIILLISLILFRNNILLFFNNIYNLTLNKNAYHEAEIELLNEKIKYLESEYNNLNNFKLSLANYANYNYEVTRIIYRENYFYNADVLIEGGSNMGFKEGMSVVNENGLVGIISKVRKNTSRINLLANCKDLSVNVNGVYGKLVYDDGEFLIKDISRDVNINLNDEVFTSTLGNIKEKIYIGKVFKVENETIEKKIVVKSKVDFDNLNYLLVVGDL